MQNLQETAVLCPAERRPNGSRIHRPNPWLSRMMMT